MNPALPARRLVHPQYFCLISDSLEAISAADRIPRQKQMASFCNNLFFSFRKWRGFAWKVAMHPLLRRLRVINHCKYCATPVTTAALLLLRAGIERGKWGAEKSVAASRYRGGVSYHRDRAPLYRLCRLAAWLWLALAFRGAARGQRDAPRCGARARARAGQQIKRLRRAHGRPASGSATRGVGCGSGRASAQKNTRGKSIRFYLQRR